MIDNIGWLCWKQALLQIKLCKVVKKDIFNIYLGNTTSNLRHQVQKNCGLFSKEAPRQLQHRTTFCQNLFLEIFHRDEQTFDWCSNNKVHFVETWLFQRYPQSDRSKDENILSNFHFKVYKHVTYLAGSWHILSKTKRWVSQYMISWGIEVRMNSFQARMSSFQTRRNSFYAEGRLEWNHSSLE